MARPSAPVIFEHVDDEGRGLAVCRADAVYAVVYQGQPVQLRSNLNVDADYPGWKYLRTSFVNPGHAFNLADRLNTAFNTADFAVIQYRLGRMIQRPQ